MFPRVAAFLFLLTLHGFAAPGDERLAARYKQVLIANPAEGIALDRLWELHQKNGSTVQLLDEFRASRETFSGALIYGLLLQKAGQIENARVEFGHAAKLYPKAAAPHLALAETYRDEPKMIAAETEKAAALLPPGDPKSTDVLLKLGNAWLSANDSVKATEAWERIVALHPDDLELRRRLAENYEKNGLGEKASEHFEYISAHGDPAQRALAFQDLARLRQARGEPDRAIAAIESGLALTAPGNWLRTEMQSQLIRIHQRYGRTSEMEQRWKNSVAENPRDLAGYARMIDLYERTGNLDGQREWLEKSAALAPKNRETRLKLARVAAQLNDLDRAVGLMDDLLKEKPGDADLVFSRAELDLQRDAVQPANARVEAMLAAPECSDTVRAKGIEFYKKHRLFDALEQALCTQTGDDAIIALADFYSEQHRPAEAAKVLERLVHPADLPEKQGEAFARIAEILRDQRSPVAALSAMQRAVALRPHHLESYLLLAEMLAGQNRLSEATGALETARNLSPDAAGRVAVDHKWFQLLQAAAPREEASFPVFAGKARLDLHTVLSARSRPMQPMHNPLVETFMGGITQEAEKNPTAERLLRVAQWRFWNGEFKTSLDFAQRAIDSEPKNLEARELAEKAANSAGLKPVALAQLYELAKLDPKPARTREVGRAELQLGHIGEALRIFGQFVAESPGDPEALADLALAQQQAEHWTDALETWQRAYAASPPARKKEILQPLLRVMERLGKAEMGAALLLRAIDETSDENGRAALLQDLLTMATRDKLLPFVMTELNVRHRTRPDDAFTSLALAKTLQAAGRGEEALALLADASYAGSGEAVSLPELVREAESLGRLEEAIQHQRRLVANERTPDFSVLQKLAQLQEANLEIGPARQTWERIVRNFPREPPMLHGAADFFQRWNLDDLARQNLRKIRVIEPTDFKALAALAQLSIDNGDNAEALSCDEQVIEKSEPESPDDVLIFPTMPPPNPAASSLRPTEAVHADGSEPSSTREIRLAAIRGASGIFRKNGGTELAAWLTRWRQSDTRSEAIWAFFYAGEPAETLQRVRGLSPPAPEAYVWLGLQMRQYAPLSEWVLDNARSTAERETFLATLGQFLIQKSALDPQLVAQLFPAKCKLRDLLWQAAVLFASRNHFQEAIGLGERVLPQAVAQRAGIALELAHWHLVIGDGEKARGLLRIAFAERGNSFEQPPYAALREYFRLLDLSEREKFCWEFTAALDSEHFPIHAGIALTVLHALCGDDDSAGAEMTRLLALRPAPARNGDEPEGTTGYRFWTFVLTAGAQLQEWKRDDLATMWWERALADSAAISLQGDSAAGVTREIRLRLSSLRLAHCGGEEAEILATEIVRKLPPESASALASLLENGGFPARAAAVYRSLWHRDLQNQQFLRGILNASRTAGDTDAVEEALREAVATGHAGPNPAMYRQALVQLVDILEARGATAEAQRMIEQAMSAAKEDPTLLDRLAGFHQRRGRVEAAEKLRRRLCVLEPGNPEHRLALARLLDEAGRTSEAVELIESAREGAGAPGSDVALFDLYLKSSEPGKASGALGRIVRAGNFGLIPDCAARLAKKGEGKQAARILHSAAMQCRDVRQRFALEVGLVGLLRDGPENGALVAGVFKQMKQTATTSPDLLPGYFEAVARQSDGETELRKAWNDGAGSLAAGGQLLRMAFERKDDAAARGVAEQLIAHPAANEQTFEELRRRAAEAGQNQLAARFAEARCREPGVDAQAYVNWAMSLQANGNKAEALGVLDRLALRRVFSDDLAAQLARAYLEAGEPARAKVYFAEALRADPDARNYDTYLRGAELLLADGNVAQARHLLRAAFGNPANQELGALVKFYASTTGIERLPDGAAEFQIKGERLRKLWVAVISQYCQAHDLEKAVAFASEHPDIVVTKKESRALLCAEAKNAGRFAECVSLLESALAQSPESFPEIAPDLAQLLTEFAEHDLAADDPNAAHKHLSRAHELAPKKL